MSLPKSVETILLAQILLRGRLGSLHRNSALKGGVVAAGIVRVWTVAVAAVRAVRVHSVARLLKAIDGIHIVAHVRALSIIPTRIRLHPVAVSHALWWPSDRSAHAVAMLVTAIAAMLASPIVAGAGVAVLLVSVTVIAAPTAIVSAHDIGLVGAHGLRSASVFAINGCFKRLDGVERALPSRARRIGEIGIDYGWLDCVVEQC